MRQGGGAAGPGPGPHRARPHPGATPRSAALPIPLLFRGRFGHVRLARPRRLRRGAEPVSAPRLAVGRAVSSVSHCAPAFAGHGGPRAAPGRWAWRGCLQGGGRVSRRHPHEAAPWVPGRPAPGGSSRQRLLGQRAGPGPPEKQSQRGGRMHRLSRSSAMTTGSQVMQADKSQGRQLASQGPGKSQGLGSRPEAGVTVAPAARKSGQRARHLGLFRPSTDRTRPTHIGGQGALSVYPFQC